MAFFFSLELLFKLLNLLPEAYFSPILVLSICDKLRLEVGQLLVCAVSVLKFTV